MYLAKFLPGFSPLAGELLQRLPVRLIALESDIALFDATKRPDLPWAHDLFRVLGSYPARSMNELLRAVIGDGRWATTLRSLAQGETFRLQCMERDQLIKPDAQMLRQIEQMAYRAGLSVHRAAPRHEMRAWLRDGGKGLLLLRLAERRSEPALPAGALPAGALPAGALRADLCHLLCRMADIGRSDHCLDPFCGSGAIPRAMLYYRPERIDATDADAAAIARLRSLQGIRANVRDALAAPPNERYNVIITDPPWGRYQKALGQDYMHSLFQLFSQQLLPGGRLVLLLHRSMPVEIHAQNAALALESRLDALYAGNKIKALRFVREDEEDGGGGGGTTRGSAGQLS